MIVEALAASTAILLFYLVRFKIRSNYWTSLGVKQPASNPFLIGNNPVTCFDRLIGKINIGDAAYKQYKEYDGEKMYGTYKLPICRPVLMLRDMDLIRDIFIKDFGHFVDRNRPFFGHDGPTHTDLAWQRQMSSARGDDWKELRSMFSPIFTSGKLKTMLHLINAVSKDIENHLQERVKVDGRVELKEVFGKFSMDAIASSAFGIEAGSFNSESGSETEFVKHAKTIFML